MSTLDDNRTLLPDLRGQSLGNGKGDGKALDRLRQNGIEKTKLWVAFEVETPDGFEENKVLSTDPPAGSDVTPEQVVDIIVFEPVDRRGKLLVILAVVGWLLALVLLVILLS